MINRTTLENFLDIYNKNQKIKINEATEFMKIAHGNQKRDSGEPYWYHPIHVAFFTSRIITDANTIIAALLHDTVEDTYVTFEEIEQNFGKDVMSMVHALTKYNLINNKKSKLSKEQYMQKLFCNDQDIKVLVIKLADRLHNIQTIHFIECPDRRNRIIEQTQKFFILLAKKLGLFEYAYLLHYYCSDVHKKKYNA